MSHLVLSLLLDQENLAPHNPSVGQQDHYGLNQGVVFHFHEPSFLSHSPEFHFLSTQTQAQGIL